MSFIFLLVLQNPGVSSRVASVCPPRPRQGLGSNVRTVLEQLG